jgi:hypothetical protein
VSALKADHLLDFLCGFRKLILAECYRFATQPIYRLPGLVNKNSFFFRFYRETSSKKTYLSINSILNIASRE